MNASDAFTWGTHETRQSPEVLGNLAYELIKLLYPICRSITGDGLRETLRIIDKEIGLDIRETPSGTAAFDWTIPDEWNIRDGFIANMAGERLVDFKKSNLHVLNYSEPVDKVVSREELDQHLFSIEEYPDWVPYRTSYYNRNWGFCLTENQRKTLRDLQYRVVIDSDLKPGSLSYGEKYIAGRSSNEFLIYSHSCHPSLCNDNLSGISIAIQLIKELEQKNLNNSYRFIFGPGTIGSVTWLSQNMEKLSNIKAGLILAVAGDAGPITYKKSRSGDSYVDRIVLNVLDSRGQDYNVVEFSPWGYDERQFSSPGINLPVGSLTRTRNDCYPEYHTSADNLDLVKPECLADSISAYLDVFNLFDNNVSLVNTSPFGEPQLGKRGLYPKMKDSKEKEADILAKLWVLNLSDGDHDLLGISTRSGLGFRVIQSAARELFEADLLETTDSA